MSHHGEKSFCRRLIKPVQMFQLLDSLLIKPHISPVGRYGNASLSPTTLSLNLGNQFFHRPPWNKLSNREGYQHDSE